MKTETQTREAAGEDRAEFDSSQKIKLRPPAPTSE